MSYVVIDLQNFKVLKKTSTELKAAYHVDLLVPQVKTKIIHLEKKAFSALKGSELMALYKNCYPAGAIPQTYKDCLVAVYDYCAKISEDTRSVKDLLRLTGQKPLPDFEKKEKTQPLIKAPSVRPRVEIARPKEGSVTGKVWTLAESIYEEGQTIDKEFRTKLVELCVANGINPSTASTQYSKWKRFTESKR